MGSSYQYKRKKLLQFVSGLTIFFTGLNSFLDFFCYGYNHRVDFSYEGVWWLPVQIEFMLHSIHFCWFTAFEHRIWNLKFVQYIIQLWYVAYWFNISTILLLTLIIPLQQYLRERIETYSVCLFENSGHH